MSLYVPSNTFFFREYFFLDFGSEKFRDEHLDTYLKALSTSTEDNTRMILHYKSLTFRAFRSYVRMSASLFTPEALAIDCCLQLNLIANLHRHAAATQAENPEASLTPDVSTSIHLHAVSIRKETQYQNVLDDKRLYAHRIIISAEEIRSHMSFLMCRAVFFAPAMPKIQEQINAV